jgi:hypothetical protein
MTRNIRHFLYRVSLIFHFVSNSKSQKDSRAIFMTEAAVLETENGTGLTTVSLFFVFCVLLLLLF